MLVYRICQSKYASTLIGPGIEGRWNSQNQKVIYTGGSCALSCLEVAVHKSGASLTAGDFSITTIEIPDKLKIIGIDIKELGEINSEWYKASNHLCTRFLGDEWLKSLESAVLKVPSAIIPNEFNFLLNVNHPDFSQISIKQVIKFVFDPRLKCDSNF
jgi:RES domain-containing protein